MRALMLEAEDYLAERRRLGHDRFDELWDGVIHMVPPPSSGHQICEALLFRALDAIAIRRGWQALFEVGLFDPHDDTNYRQPDNVIVDPKYLSRRGIEGRTELVVEVRSPRDEAYEKLPFYAKVGVQEYWIVVHETPSFEVYAPVAGVMMRIEPIDGVVTTPMGLRVSVAGDKLVIVDGPDRYEV